MNKHWPSDHIANAVCRWNVDVDGVWHGDCGIRWSCEFETPEDNGMNYCYRCGKTLVQKLREKPSKDEIDLWHLIHD